MRVSPSHVSSRMTTLRHRRGISSTIYSSTCDVRLALLLFIGVVVSYAAKCGYECEKSLINEKAGSPETDLRP